MRIVNLVENTPGAPGCGWAHGLSFYVETARHRLLMDTGPSDLLVANAKALGIDLRRVDTVILSHGHYDHSDGIPAFATLNPEARVYLRRGADGAFYSSAGGAPRYIGMDPRIAGLDRLIWVDGELILDDELSLFGSVTGRKAWPRGNRKLSRLVGNRHIQDDFVHEQCLVVTDGGRRVLLSGCAHSGILNILDRYRQIYGGAPDAVVSGFHMKQPEPYAENEADLIRETARALARWPGRFYTCHCTSLPAFELMKPILGDRLSYVHSGEEIDVNA